VKGTRAADIAGALAWVAVGVVAARMKHDANGTVRPPAVWRGGGPRPQRYVLSGLLRCASCGARLIMSDRYNYSCGAHRDGDACANGVRVTRRELEEKLLHERLFKLLDDPDQVALAAKELATAYRAHLASEKRAASEAPAELRDLNARIARLRERLRQGDPDLTPDELEAAIARAEAKRGELEARQPSARASARVIEMLPGAAAEFRKQLTLGLEGSERDVLRARVALRRHFGGEIRVESEPGGGVIAHWREPLGAVFKAVVTDGSGGRIR
jgi:site-specific DNA recombinase